MVPSWERFGEGAASPGARWPRVSVIVAAYNAAGKVATAVNSVLSQSVREIEIIVVDDCSMDGTAEVVTRIGVSDSRVRLLRRPVNGGPGTARNSALDVAKGEWISVIDADDSMAPNRLETLLTIGNAQSLDLVADNLRLVDDGSGSSFGLMFPAAQLEKPKIITAEDFVRNNRPSSVKRKYGLLKPIIRRQFLERHDIRYVENSYLGEDFLLYLECLIQGAHFMLIPESYYSYQISRGSLSQTRGLDQAATFLRQCDNLLGRPDVLAQPGLTAALRERSEELRRDFVYLQFMTALKRWQLRNMMRVARSNLQLLPYIGAQSTRVLRLRARQWAGSVRRHEGARKELAAVPTRSPDLVP